MKFKALSMAGNCTSQLRMLLNYEVRRLAQVSVSRSLTTPGSSKNHRHTLQWWTWRQFHINLIAYST